jgi:HicA toxin of bacterial toxin-antitoxin,
MMASKHRKTFEAIYANPVRANIAWNDAVSMFESFGATVNGVGGSMFEVDLNGVKAIFHKPHPGTELSKGRVRAIRAFLDQAGVNSDDL